MSCRRPGRCSSRSGAKSDLKKLCPLCLTPVRVGMESKHFLSSECSKYNSHQMGSSDSRTVSCMVSGRHLGQNSAHEPANRASPSIHWDDVDGRSLERCSNSRHEPKNFHRNWDMIDMYNDSDDEETMENSENGETSSRCSKSSFFSATSAWNGQLEETISKFSHDTKELCSQIAFALRYEIEEGLREMQLRRTTNAFVGWNENSLRGPLSRSVSRPGWTGK